MIRHGRRVVDRFGLAEIWGVSAAYLANRLQPWNEPNHPHTVNEPRTARGHRWLWDSQQATAYRNGERIPALPRKNSPGDLLDADDVAAELGVALATVTHMRRDGRLPFGSEADDDIGVWHIRRDTLAQRPRQPVGSPREPKSAAKERVYAVLEEAGGHISTLEIRRRAEVSKPTAVKYRDEFLNAHADARVGRAPSGA